MDPQEMQAGEKAEDQAFAQIMQICQSAQDASGYQQIMQIIQQLEAHNKQEEGAGQEGAPDMAGRVMARIQANKGQQPQGE
jgi:hypothetical protein